MNDVVKSTREEVGVIATLAQKYNMRPDAFEATLRATCVPKETTREQFAAFLLVASKYGLNPVTREIYAFSAKGGGVQPIVSIDGWIKLINSHPDYDHIEFEDHLSADGQITAITAKIYRRGRAGPTTVTEYMSECARPTEPWRQWPRRMLRHKATIQCARYAFGFSGIYDQDEVERGLSPAAPPIVDSQADKDVIVDISDGPTPDEMLRQYEDAVTAIASEAELDVLRDEYLADPALQSREHQQAIRAMTSRARHSL